MGNCSSFDAKISAWSRSLFTLGLEGLGFGECCECAPGSHLSLSLFLFILPLSRGMLESLGRDACLLAESWSFWAQALSYLGLEGSLSMGTSSVMVSFFSESFPRLLPQILKPKPVTIISLQAFFGFRPGKFSCLVSLLLCARVQQAQPP